MNHTTNTINRTTKRTEGCQLLSCQFSVSDYNRLSLMAIFGATATGLQALACKPFLFPAKVIKILQ